MSARETGLKDRIMVKLETWTLRSHLPRLREVPSEGLLYDVYAALGTLPTATIMETNLADLHHGSSDQRDAWL